jgi:exopolyphosphatase / guanosine-5'-triphosphate,3'-diphosphate pyrophosphatase
MKRVAVFDCGTNSIRLLIAEFENGDVRELDRRMTIVRLGEGIDETGEFSSDALKRTFIAVDDFAKVLQNYEIHAVRFVATSASRDARNRAEFESGIQQRLGVKPEIISGEEEAELSFLGATAELSTTTTGPFLVIDIGGGSTEFVVGESVPSAARSVNIGCVRMTERHLKSDPPTETEITAAELDIDAAIVDAMKVVDVAQAAEVIGLAGSVTTVAAMAMGLEKYDRNLIHGTVLSNDQVEAACNRLLHKNREQRSALPFMHPGRIDVIGAGALVLRQIMRALPQTHLRISEHDILDGIAAKLAATLD